MDLQTVGADQLFLGFTVPTKGSTPKAIVSVLSEAVSCGPQGKP